MIQDDSLIAGSVARGGVNVRIVVLQGPNLTQLGVRRPEIYGKRTLAEIQESMDKKAEELGCSLEHFQSNSEGALIDWLQERQDESDAIICNPAGLTNYGLSLRDALAETERDLAIVHLSNVHAREQWRRHDVYAEVTNLYIAGLGWRGYVVAIDALHERYVERKESEAGQGTLKPN
jgi:3-dehydroquinate dehydratase-2